MDDPVGTRPKVLYVMGPQRGGTTVAGRLLGQLPGFVFVGELRKLWQVGLPEGRRCGCGATYDACEVWSSVLPKVLGSRSIAAVGRWQRSAVPGRASSIRAWRSVRRTSEIDDVAARAYASLVSDTYLALAEATGARVIVDTSKLVGDAVLISRMEQVEPYFIQIVRDPRGTVYSAIRRSGRPTGFHPREDLLGSAGWLVRHGSAIALRRKVGPNRSMVVKYEHLVANPNVVLDRAADLVGEPHPGPIVIEGKATLTVAHTPIGGGRFGPTSLDLALDDRWVTAMSRADRLVVGALTRPLARRFGYPGLRPTKDRAA